jgi:hypothetical protein
MSNARSERLNKYIDLCRRLVKAEMYMDGPALVEEKEKWVPTFRELLKEMCDIAESEGLTEDECTKFYEYVR